MKKFLTATFAIILAAVTLLSAEPALAENNYDMVIPDGDCYLYLEKPVQIAANSDGVAILDEGLQSVVISGETLKHIDVSDALLYGRVLDMEFFDDKILLLAEGDELKFFAYNVGGNPVDLPYLSVVETPSAMALSDDCLFVFDGYRTVWQLNYKTGETASFKSKKPLFAEHIAVDDSTIYSLSFSGDLTKISLSDGTMEQSGFLAEGATDLVAYGNKIFAVTDDGLAENGKVILSSHVADCAVFGANLYVLDGSTTISMFDKNFAKVREIGSSSNKLGKLKSPKDIAFYGKNVAVADNGNGRVQIFGENGVEFCETVDDVKDLVWVAGTLYVLSGEVGRLTAIDFDGSDFGIRQTYYVSTDISLLLTDGKRLYGYNKNSDILQLFSGGAFSAGVGSMPQAIKIKSSPIGKIFYSMSQTGIQSISAVGKTDAKLTFDQSFAAIDFVVDTKGNLYVLHGGEQKQVKKYVRVLDGYVEDRAVTLENDRFPLDEATALEADENGNLYVVSSSRHFVARLSDNLGFDKDKGVYNDADLSTITSSKDVFVASISAGLLQKSKTDFELTEPVAGVNCVVFKGLSDQTFSYVLTSDGAFGYVRTSLVSAPLTDEIPSFTELKMLHTSGGDVYNFPLFADVAKQASVGSDVLLKIVGSGAGFHIGGHYWYEVEYTLNGQTKTGFVLRTRVVDYSASDVLNVVGTAKIASGLGKSVSVYSLSDDKSEVLRTLTEGDRIELLEEYDQNKPFLLVRLNPIDGNECVGYVKTKYITLNTGLTDGQIVGIVLAAVCAVATVAVVLFVRRSKESY